MSNDKWIKKLFATPKKVRLYERERVLVDATETICQVMNAQSVTRSDLADRLGVTQANVTQILSGERNLTLGTLSDVFVALGQALVVTSTPLAGDRGWTLTPGWKRTSSARPRDQEPPAVCIDNPLVA